MGEFKKIGVWNTAFLGDAVLTMHLIKALNMAYPDSEVHFFVRGGLESLFENMEGITSATGFYKRSGQKSLLAARRLGQEIGSQGFDLWISSHTSLRSAVVAGSTGIPTRIGYDAPFYNKWAYTHTVPRRFDELEEVERLMQLVGAPESPLGIHGPAPWPELFIDDEDTLDAMSFVLDNADAPMLGMHPGSTWPTKKWPVKYYADILRHAIDAGWRVSVFAGPGEEADAAAVIQESGRAGHENITDFSGQLNLVKLAAYISAMNLYLTNDSGPMHLSWIQKVPTVALFGPTVQKLGFFPRGDHSKVMEVDGLSCRPCGLHGPKKCPKGHFKCMLDLTPNVVWKEIQERMTLAMLPTGGKDRQ